VSKRSYRRLALVAGTALAVGSMAPAMAAHVDATGAGTAGLDVSGVSVPNVTLPLGVVAGVKNTALTTVQSTQQLLVADVANIASDLFYVGQAGVGAVGSPSADVNAGLDVGSLAGTGAGISAITGANGNASAGVTVPLDLSGVMGGPGLLVGDAKTAASQVVGIATGTAQYGLLTAGQLQNSIVSNASGVLYGLPGLTGTLTADVLASASGSF
jgi:hypothetical protein